MEESGTTTAPPLMQGACSTGSISGASQPLHRPHAFDKMEELVREMLDPENGVRVRTQKMFLTFIPFAFIGYDLIEWLMDRLIIEESEALNIANQLCQHGYFFPVSDSKNLVVKDDSSYYRFQVPYYWPWQNRPPDNVEYAIYLLKRSLRNRQRHGLEEYEAEALASLRNNLKAKWDCITMQAEEQVKIAKERKKVDKIIADSQERAFWRVYRPPPGVSSSLEPCPAPSRDRQGGRPRRRTVEDVRKEVELLRSSLTRTRVKVSVAVESLVNYAETYAEYDPLITPSLPSNPWVSEDVTFWQLNGPIVEQPTEKRVRRWGHSMEELVSDPTGLQEFTAYLRKEYSHENIRFWTAANDLRRSAHSQIQRKVKEIYEEFLAPGAPCEINIDGKTMERVQRELKVPSRFTFDAAAEHVYALLLKKDCYPRFVRSEHYKALLAAGVQPSHKKRFFGFGGAVRKKTSTTTAPNPALLQQSSTGPSLIPHSGPVGAGTHTAPSIHAIAGATVTGPGHYRRRGSDRSLSGSAHELAVGQGKNLVPHSHSQSNLSDIPYSREPIAGGSCDDADLDRRPTSDICPWETGPEPPPTKRTPMASTSEEPAVSPVSSTGKSRKNSGADSSGAEGSLSTSTCGGSSSAAGLSAGGMAAAAVGEVAERLRRTCGIRQSTLDCDNRGTRRLSIANHPEHRRASVTLPNTAGPGLAGTPLFLSADLPLALPLLLPQSRGSEPATIAPKPTGSQVQTPRTPAISVSEVLPGQVEEDTVQEEAEENETETEKGASDSAEVQLLQSEPASSESTPLPSPACIPVAVPPACLPVAISPACIPTAVSPAVAPLAEVELDPTEEEDFAIAEPQAAKIQNQVQVKPSTQSSESSKTSEENVTKTSEETIPVTADTCEQGPNTAVDGAGKSGEDSKQPATEKDVKEGETPQDKTNEGQAEGATADSKAAGSSNEDEQRREVCPWEDEETCMVDTTPFVKTYATLGYL